MKEGIHPAWFHEATVVCACGNTWKTGATQEEIRTDICSACHPFYTGEQRIVDTEGQVDRFLKRLQSRDRIRDEADAREASKTPSDLPLAELELTKRALTTLEEHGVITVQDYFDKMADGGEEGFLELAGIGRKILADLKKTLRARGYEIAESE